MKKPPLRYRQKPGVPLKRRPLIMHDDSARALAEILIQIQGRVELRLGTISGLPVNGSHHHETGKN